MAVYDGEETFRPLGWRPTLLGIRFSGEMRDFVLVVGTDYADAFRRLFDTWTPGDGAARPGLPTAPSAAPPGGEGFERAARPTVLAARPAPSPCTGGGYARRVPAPSTHMSNSFGCWWQS